MRNLPAKGAIPSGSANRSGVQADLAAAQTIGSILEHVT
jgi:hypothetical protein